MALTLEAYQADRASYRVDRAMVQQALARIQPLAVEALGLHAARHVLWDGWLPVNPIMTAPESNGGWGELMPVWFKPYERPVPLYCLDNWALFAGLYREAFGVLPGGEFNAENLVRVIVGADILIPFLPTTQGMGRFLRQGALTVLLSICWLEAPVRDAWLALHAAGARAVARELAHLADEDDLDGWLAGVETNAFLVPEQARVTDESSIKSFLANESDCKTYLRLLQCLCLSVTALAAKYGVNWREWAQQAVSLHYPLARFGLEEIARWVRLEMKQS